MWIALGSPRNRNFKLYEGLGRERQKLVDPFPAMMLDASFSFAPGLAHQEAMLKALASYRREVQDDGVAGNELATALFLASGTGRSRGRAFTDLATSEPTSEEPTMAATAPTEAGGLGPSCSPTAG